MNHIISQSSSLKIILKNYQVKMHLGFLPHEKIKPQNVSIDVEITFQKQQMIMDDVNEVFNYQHIIDVIDEMIQKPFNLQEFLIQELANALIVILKNLDVKVRKNIKPQSLLIRTQKLEAYEHAQSIGVEAIYDLNIV